MDELLYGHGQIMGITGLKVDDYGQVVIWQRSKDGILKTLNDRFKPFIVTSSKDVVSSLFGSKVIELDGDLFYKFKVEVPNYQLLKNILKDENNKGNIVQYNLIEQYLISSGNTFYKGLDFDDLVRMQIDIETTHLNPRKGRIFAIAISTSQGFSKVMHGHDEKVLLNSLNMVIKKLDPDIIENHNIFKFDLPYILERARFHGVKIKLGRTDENYRLYKDTLKSGGETLSFDRISVTGREIVDSLHSSRRYDANTGKLGGVLNLKDVAKKMKVNRSDDSSYIAGDLIYKTYLEDPQRLIRYASSDVKEVNEIIKALNQTEFQVTQMVPMRYEKVCTSGSSRIVELPLVRHYLHQNHSIPRPAKRSVEKYAGGYVEMFQSGLFKNVTKLDVKSMYPSIILNNDIRPVSDPLNVFQNILRKLTSRRLEYKEKSHFDDRFKPMEKAYKIIINSHYGYLGYPYGKFNDVKGAEMTTKIGQEIVKEMIRIIELLGGEAIDVDTDGVLCKYPVEYDVTGFNDAVKEKLVNYPYIEIEAEPKDRPIDAAYIYKPKNYAVLVGDELTIKGSSFKAKSVEPIFKNFLSAGTRILLEQGSGELFNFYQSVKDRLMNGEINAQDICKKFQLKKSLSEYRDTLKKTQPHYEVLIRLGISASEGDSCEFYKALGEIRYKHISEYDGDYDKEHYLKALEKKMLIFEKAFC